MTVMVLLRRWYITVPAFFASLGLAAAAYSLTPVEYESVGVLVLTTPVKTSRSLAWTISSGPTGPMASPSPQTSWW